MKQNTLGGKALDRIPTAPRNCDECGMKIEGFVFKIVGDDGVRYLCQRCDKERIERR